MRSIQPARKIKAKLHLLFVLLILFFTTLAACLVVFSLFTFFSERIISPLTQKGADMESASAAVLVQSLCRDAKLACQEIIPLPGDAVEVTLDSGTIAFLSTKKDLKKQLASLQQVVAQLTIKGKQLKKIDFRFNSVVVTF